MTATINSLSIAPSGVYGSTLTMQNPLTVISTVTVGAKGVITHSANSVSEVYKSSITANSMTIAGLINVTGNGYTSTTGYPSNGPGSPTGNWAAASYGGEGGQDGGAYQAAPYGSFSAPTNIGSGGYCSSIPATDAGGGSVILNVTSTLTVTGSILADGVGEDDSGSGGSIFITAGYVVGGGTLSANGGGSSTAGSCSGASCAGGGGGRIAVVASTSGFPASGTLTGATGRAKMAPPERSSLRRPGQTAP